MLGGIEAGGTKFVCGAGTGPDDLRRTQFPTTLPDETIAQAVRFFRENAPEVQAIGIGSFGPVDLDERSPHFGGITSTPKPGWENCSIAQIVASELGVPVMLDTDVNAALLGEARWGAAKDVQDAVYITVGTGVGGGVLSNGQIIHGLMHPEIGHLRLPHDFSRDRFAGSCPYHGDCLEGLASGPAIAARWGRPATDLERGHPAWALEAHYLALGLINLTVAVSPRRIILGGGVMQQEHLFALTRAEFARLMNAYIKRPELTDHLDQYIVPPALKQSAGVLGALVLGEKALVRAREKGRAGVQSHEGAER